MSEFARIFDPKAERAVKAIALLTNGTRYKPTEEEIARTLGVLKDAVNDIAQLYGVLPGGEVVVKDVPLTEPETSEERVEAKSDAIAKGDWPFLSIDKRVRAIPDNQLSAYVTQIMHRMSERFDTGI
jgi:hypothetical protein